MGEVTSDRSGPSTNDIENDEAGMTRERSLSLLNCACLTSDPARADTEQGDNHAQRPQAELEAAAFAFRRLGFGRLSLHGRIIPDRGQPEQGCREAGNDTV